MLTALLTLIQPVMKGKPVTGIAFHLCGCNAPCPCMFTGGDDMPGCSIIAVYHFKDGGYVDSLLSKSERRRGVKPEGKLAGTTMVVVSRPRDLYDKDVAAKAPSPLTAAVYIPKNLPVRQQKNLKFILFEHQSRFAWGASDTRLVDIKFSAIPGGYSVEIPGVLDAKTQAILGADKKAMTVNHVSFQEGALWTLGKTTMNNYADPKEKEWHWDYAKRNGAWCSFSWNPIYHP